MRGRWLALMAGAASIAAADAPRDWQATLSADARAFHNQIA